ncbi:MAG: hypothetical protein Q7J07_03485 [Pelolinea sp.]|nr:hypothetical protein [Pelolinea sp.]
MAIDFVTYQLQSRGGKEFHLISGVLVEKAARTTHRHRQGDLLAIFLSFSGDHRYPDEEINELVRTASGIYFHTQGSVTRAIQNVIEDLNKRVLDRNLDRGYEGVQADGSVNVSVLHNDWLFMGQVGDAHTYTIGSDRFERYGEDGESIEKLGRSKRIQPRLYQCELHTDDLILMSPQSHASWKAYYLSGSTELTMSQVKRRLQNQLIKDFSVLAIKAEEGNGKVRAEEWEIEIDTPNLEEQKEPIQDYPKTEIELSKGSLPIEADPRPDIHIENSRTNLEKTLPTTEEETPENTEILVTVGETEQFQPEQFGVIKGTKETEDQPNKILIALARGWMRGKTLRAKLQLFFRRIQSKVVPERSKSQDGESYTWMVVVVIAIPLILIFSSLTIYSRFGKEEQYKIFFDEAQGKLLLVEDESDPVKQHALWKEILTLSTQAEEYLVTNESRQLFQEAQTIVDNMDLTARLEFRPALTQFFPEGSSISSIKASSSGVYLLDSNSGNVLRIYLNTKGFYQLDEEFRCTPGTYGPATVSKLVDFVILPANSENYKIMALDREGNLVYCQPGEPPDSRALTTPTGGWSEIIGTVYTNDILYVVDAGTSMVWIYRGNETDNTNMSGIVFTESPTPFFDEDIPDLVGAIDASINEEDLYILHDDGHMTICQYSLLKDVKLTECEDPAPFTDNRVGSGNKKPWIFMGTNFLGLEQTRFSNASLYLLDGVSSTLYQFSYQLNLERTLKPQANRNYPMPTNPPSGFGITPDKEVFIAYGNQLFIAPMQ